MTSLRGAFTKFLQNSLISTNYMIIKYCLWVPFIAWLKHSSSTKSKALKALQSCYKN